METQAKEDIETALTKITDRGKAIYKQLPEPSKLNFSEYWQ